MHKIELFETACNYVYKFDLLVFALTCKRNLVCAIENFIVNFLETISSSLLCLKALWHERNRL